MKCFCLAIAILITPGLTEAARPFVTDDARLTTGGSCQLESWTRIYSTSQEVWALPACNPFGNLEFTVGGGRSFVSDVSSDDYLFQAKTLLRPLTTNSWGWGLAVGTIQHPEITPGPNMFGNIYAYIPASMSFYDDNLITHMNLGWLKDKATGFDIMSWGLGNEIKLLPRLLGIAEIYGDNQAMSYGQIGFRYSIVPDIFQVDATIGQQLSGSGDSQWYSFGIRYTPEKIF